MKYDERLQELRGKVSQKAKLEAKYSELQAQYADLKNRVQELRCILQKEQADVERLEQTSLAALFYAALGKKEDQLDKEKLEAYAAKAKYDSAARELHCVEEDIRCVEAHLSEIDACESAYAALLQQKMEAIEASHSAEAERLLRLEEQMAVQESRKKEIAEALAAGSYALHTAEEILSSLDSAESWGTWDLFGGGLLSDIAKHDHLDQAQQKVQQLQEQLRQFKTELADVTIQAEMQVGIDGFLRFADYFFDDLFSDWAVLSKIRDSQSSVQNTKRQIEEVLSQLTAMEDTTTQELTALQDEKAAVIVNTAL